jgi:hypothetical protein
MMLLIGIGSKADAQAGDIYYFIPKTGSANVLANWNTAPDGSGTAAGTYTLGSENKIYIINNGKSATITAAFGAQDVFILVGDEGGGSLYTGTSGTLTTGSGTISLQATINVNANSVFNYKMSPTAAYHPTLGYLHPTSTVVYDGNAAQNVLLANYGNLKINNALGVTLLGNIGISDTLSSLAGTINTTTNHAAISFNGNVAQTIPGNTVYAASNAYKITINNNAGVTLANNATLTILDSLIVNSGDFILGNASNAIIKGLSYVPTAPIVDSAYKPGYTLVWNDEFTGTANAAPNPNVWAHHSTKRTVPDTVVVWGDTIHTLSITNNSYLDGNGHLLFKVDSINGVYYSGDVATASPYAFMKQYGYMESKIMFTHNNGVDCTFWLQSPTVSKNPQTNDPATYGTEMDICEYLGPSNTYPRGCVNTTIHKDGYDTMYTQSTASHNKVSNTGWHILALEWAPTYCNFYTDGVLQWTMSDTAFISKRPEFIVLGAGCGWTSPLKPAGNTWPVYMQVDYVRVYNKD